ncbi:D-alanine--D-alanine ligase [Candidatus Pelagibacter bacterium]|nr:D-alanine--D-alanine ligase [Candidatus Pelagibacter bacterium]MDC3104467.1 D-alanine--D-alanine ligase [Candidatus Pelagibacter bacterium]
MKNKKVLVVLGGNSGERKVSLESGRACVKALKKNGYKVSTFDPKKKSLNLIDKNKVDIIFNALHGKGGEDGIAQSYFEYLRIPYTHSGIISSYNAMNKVISKEIFKKNKINSPRYFVIKKENYKSNKLASLLKKKGIKFPMVVKPINEGSSLGVNICKNSILLKKKVQYLFKRYSELIFEPFIGGQEIQVAVINGSPLGAIELKPKREFYDYKAKYSKSAKTIHIMPAKLKRLKYKQAMQIATKAHNVLGCKGITRSDFKFFKNKFYLLEINTQPGMTSLSLVPEIAKFKGISFEKLVLKILLNAGLNR